MSEIGYSLALYRDGGQSKLAEEGRCRMCRTPRKRRGVRQLTRHHLVPQRWPGWARLGFKLRDADANIIPLCGNCHRAVERDEWARRMLRKVLGSCEVAFARKTMGETAFDEMYPPTRRLAREARAA